MYRRRQIQVALLVLAAAAAVAPRWVLPAAPDEEAMLQGVPLAVELLRAPSLAPDAMSGEGIPSDVQAVPVGSERDESEPDSDATSEWMDGDHRPSGPCAPDPAGDVLVVHVAGAVEKPGVYALCSEARLIDALTAAGGLDDDRVQDHLNLARLLYDGDRIYVPTWDEVEEALAAGPGGGWDPYDAGGQPRPVDLNRADVEQLQELPGIGPSLAERIVQYRSEHGPFSRLEDVTQVSGIGPRTVAQWEERAVVRP